MTTNPMKVVSNIGLSIQKPIETTKEFYFILFFYLKRIE